MKRSKSETIKKAVEYLIKELKEQDFTVMRYDSYSSNSVYLKINDGVVGTIRISDHHGYKHLKYRYNLIIGVEKHKTLEGNFERFYFPMMLIQTLVFKVIYDHQERLERYGDVAYKHYMENNRKTGASKKGFWQKAKYV